MHIQLALSPQIHPFASSSFQSASQLTGIQCSALKVLQQPQQNTSHLLCLSFVQNVPASFPMLLTFPSLLLCKHFGSGCALHKLEWRVIWSYSAYIQSDYLQNLYKGHIWNNRVMMLITLNGAKVSWIKVLFGLWKGCWSVLDGTFEDMMVFVGVRSVSEIYCFTAGLQKQQRDCHKW